MKERGRGHDDHYCTDWRQTMSPEQDGDIPVQVILASFLSQWAVEMCSHLSLSPSEPLSVWWVRKSGPHYDDNTLCVNRARYRLLESCTCWNAGSEVMI